MNDSNAPISAVDVNTSPTSVIVLRIVSCFGSEEGQRALPKRRCKQRYTCSVKPFLDATKLDRLCVGKLKAQTSSNHTVLNEVVREAWYYKY